MSKKASSAGNQQETSMVSYNLINHKWGVLRDYTPDTSSRINKKFASLLAMLFTDGGVSQKDKHSWRIYFSNKSESLIELFKKCMMEVFRLDKRRIKIGKTRDGYFKGIVNSKEIGKYLIRRFGTFRRLKYSNGKLPDTKLPVSQLIDNRVVEEFLKTAFSCDGGLCFYPAKREGAMGGAKWLIRTIFLVCHHQKLRKDYMTLLDYLGIRAREVLRDGRIKIEREKDIRKFHKLIGFVKGVKVTNHSKFWRGYEKREVLRIMISSYKNPSLIYNLSKFS